MRTYWAVTERDGSIKHYSMGKPSLYSIDYDPRPSGLLATEVAVVPAAALKRLVEELTRIYTESVNTAQMFGEEDDDSRMDKLADRMADQRRDFLNALSEWKGGAE